MGGSGETCEINYLLCAEYTASVIVYLTSNGKVFYGQEPPGGVSTTPECDVNYQLLAVVVVVVVVVVIVARRAV